MVPYLRAANVKDGTLDLEDVKEMNFTPPEQTIFSLLPGDVLVSEGSGSLRSVGATGVWNGELPGTICFQNTLLRLRPRPGTNPRFLAWWCRYAFADGLFASIASGANIYHLSAERVRSLPMRLMTPTEQHAIADFLDAETARIDALIDKKQRLLGLVEERWAAEIAHLVESEAVRWVPLKSVARWVEGPGILAVDFRDEGTPLIRIGNLLNGTVDLTGCGYLDPSDVSQRWKHLAVRAGELLVSGSATSGRPVIVPPEAAGAVPYTGIIRMWPLSEALDRDFLDYFLQSRHFSDQVDRLKTGVGLQHWGPYHLSQVRIPLPNRGQQRESVSILAGMRAVVTNLSAAGSTQLYLLLQRRQALIGAAVTGELTVPAVAA
jgi:type I restriction enzyme S subunit